MKDVSRETADRLAALADLVRKWNPRINLVAPATLDFLRERHIDDSRQVSDALDGDHRHWVDLGSGGGFPGLVVAILRPAMATTLIESDRRKATFLRTAIRELGLMANVIAQRIEDAAPQGADVVSSRALAPLVRLLPLAIRHGRPDTTYLFPKGANHDAELAEAGADWSFTTEHIPSRTQAGSVILKLGNVRRA